MTYGAPITSSYPTTSVAAPYGSFPGFGGMPPFAGFDADKIAAQEKKAKDFLDTQAKEAEKAAKSQLDLRTKLIKAEAEQQIKMMSSQIDAQAKQEIMMLDQQFQQYKASNANMIAQKEMELKQQATQMSVMSQQYELQKSMYEQYAKTGVPAAAMGTMAGHPFGTF